MRRIVIVTDAWHPQVNGAVTVLTQLEQHLIGRGNAVTIIHPGLFKTVPMPGYPEIPLALFPYYRMKYLLKHAPKDAVHITTEGTLGLAARRVCLRQKIPFTTSYHTHFHLYLDLRLKGIMQLAYIYLRWFHAPAVATMVATPTLQHELEKNGFKHLALWPLGVDTKLFVRNTSPNLPALAAPVFVYVGRIAIEKNLEAFLSLDLPGTKLMIGDGPDRARLEAKYGKTVKFVGYKVGQELVDWMSLCNVLVFPSKTETFGLVVIEALSCGIPVAAYPVMGPKDLITNGVDGVISADLKKAALECLNLFSGNCRTKALQYSWEASVSAFVHHLAWLQKEMAHRRGTGGAIIDERYVVHPGVHRAMTRNVHQHDQ